MLKRRLQPLLEARLGQSAAVVLLGPRQAGKTTLAMEIAARLGERALYLDLERPADLRKLDDADAYLRSQVGRLVIIDEIHRVPGLFEPLRGIIDERRRAGERTGHFLLLGSASLELMRQTSETLAGRVSYLELGPLDALEIAPGDIALNQLWSRGGFPESLLAPTGEASFAWRQDFVRSYLEREVPMFAPRLPAESIGRLWTMLAHAQGSLLNASRLASSLGVASPTVSRYIDLLVDLLLVRRLRPWVANVGKRLVKAPKVYIRDSGIVHALLELDALDTLLGHPVAGPSWEGFAIENMVAAAGRVRTPYFYRTADGAEVDLLFERKGDVELAIEVKRSTAPRLSRGFHEARATLKPREAWLVHTGDQDWVADGVQFLPLPEALRRLSTE